MPCTFELARLRPSDVRGIEPMEDSVPDGTREVGDPRKSSLAGDLLEVVHTIGMRLSQLRMSSQVFSKAQVPEAPNST